MVMERENFKEILKEYAEAFLLFELLKKDKKFIEIVGENYLLENDVIDEANFPQNFDLEEFKKLNNFSKRVKYCDENLNRLGSGSSRIVYLIDDKTVLKLAKNAKGIAQNNVESDYGLNDMYGSIIAKTIEDHPNDLWIIQELAKKTTKPRFKQLLGYPVEEFGNWLTNQINVNNGRRKIFKIDENYLEKIENSEFANEVLDLCMNFNISAGDFGRISSFGEVDDNIVINDYGLTHEVYDTHYARKPKQRMYEAEYRGRKVKLNKPFRTSGGPKKFSVYVKNKNGNVIKVNFGQKGMKVRNGDAKRAKAFRDRHNCEDKKDRTASGYWSCNVGRYAKLLGLTSSSVW